MTEEVFGLRYAFLLGDWVEKRNKKELQRVSDENLFRILEHQSVVWYAPGCRVVFQGLFACQCVYMQSTSGVRTVFSREQSMERTTCLSAQEQMWVRARVPFSGSTLGDMYML